MEINMKKFILFDMDGVLINTEPLHFEVWKKLLKEIGIEIDYEHYKGCIGSTKAFLYELIKKFYGVDISNDEKVPQRFDEIREEMLKKDGIPRIEGAVETVRYLNERGYQMAVASSSSQELIERQMKGLGIDNCFQVLFSAENVKNPKPAPDVFLKVAELLGAEPEECIVVEDSQNGSRAAKAAGMTCIGFKNPDSGEQDLSCADKLIYKFEELRNYV